MATKKLPEKVESETKDRFVLVTTATSMVWIEAWYIESTWCIPVTETFRKICKS